MGRLELWAPHAFRLTSSPDPRRRLWEGHAALARDDASSALKAYRAALVQVERPPRGLERLHPELSQEDQELRWIARWWRGVARTGAGDREGWRDLEACLRERPDWGLQTLEAMADGAPRAFERQATEPLLSALLGDGDRLLSAIARRLRNGDLRKLDPAWAGVEGPRERAMIRLQCSKAAAEHRGEVLKTLRSKLLAWETGAHLPRPRFPLMLRPGQLPRGVSLEAFCKRAEKPSIDLARGQVAIAAEPTRAEGYHLAMLALYEFGELGLAVDAAREVLRRSPRQDQRNEALSVLATQAKGLEDRPAHAHWRRLLIQGGVAPAEVERRYGK